MTDICTRRLAMALMLSPLLAPAAQAKSWSRLQPATVMIVPSIHQRHQTNPNYSYDDLFRIVRTFRPDRVGVEIAPERMTFDAAYLADQYPQEMVALKSDYGDRAFGFDWAGDAPSTRTIAIDWTTSQPGTADEAELNTPERRAYAARLTQIAAERDHLLATATPYSLSTGRYNALCVDYNNTLRAYVAGTRYEAEARFATAQDAHLAANIAAAIKAHPGERIAVVTGAEHYGSIVRFLRDSMADKVALVSVPRR